MKGLSCGKHNFASFAIMLLSVYLPDFELIYTIIVAFQKVQFIGTYVNYV